MSEKGSEKELLALISSSVHDMKTPLMSISGFAEAILDGTVPEDRRAHYIGVIRDEAERLTHICDELLDASRIEAGSKSYRMEPFDICECARKVLISMERAIENKALAVSFEAEEDNISALGDERAIRRVLYNICDNAVKFSYRGGRLGISVFYEGEQITIKIENDGEGMTEEEIAQVFQPFYRNGEGSGTGLGMYIAKSIIISHGGTISAESEMGRGTAFFVRINRG